jgi:hypothetical protein
VPNGYLVEPSQNCWQELFDLILKPETGCWRQRSNGRGRSSNEVPGRVSRDGFTGRRAAVRPFDYRTGVINKRDSLGGTREGQRLQKTLDGRLFVAGAGPPNCSQQSVNDHGLMCPAAPFSGLC